MTGWVISPKAEDDLVEILSFVDQQTGSGSRSADLLAEFTHAFNLLAAQPDMGRLRPQLTGTSVRWWWVHQFAVLYENADAVRVLRVIHGARCLDALLRP